MRNGNSSGYLRSFEKNKKHRKPCTKIRRYIALMYRLFRLWI